MNRLILNGSVVFACLACRLTFAQEVPPSPAGEPVLVVRPLPSPPPPPPEPANFSFTFSAGYARLSSHGSDSLIDGDDGYYFDFDFAGRINPRAPLWAGLSINGSYFDQHSETNVSGPVPSNVDVDAAISLFALEPRLTYVLLPREDRGLYLAGRIGAGMLIADYWATQIVDRPGGTFVEGDGDTTVAFEVRPAAQVGFCGGQWVLGAEVSQMWAWGDFGRIGDELDEVRLGFFFTLRY